MATRPSVTVIEQRHLSHFPTACARAFARGRLVRVLTSVYDRRVHVLHGHLVCVRAVCVFTRASGARRVSAFSHERALHGRLVCVRDVCVLSRACVRVDVSCACRLFVLGTRALWTFGPFPSGDGYPQLYHDIVDLLHA